MIVTRYQNNKRSQNKCAVEDYIHQSDTIKLKPPAKVLFTWPVNGRAVPILHVTITHVVLCVIYCFTENRIKTKTTFQNEVRFASQNADKTITWRTERQHKSVQDRLKNQYFLWTENLGMTFNYVEFKKPSKKVVYPCSKGWLKDAHGPLLLVMLLWAPVRQDTRWNAENTPRHCVDCTPKCGTDY